MIITHTINDQGHRRVYLGGKSSMECWIEPKADGVGWSFHVQAAPGRYPLTDDEQRTWATHMLLSLAGTLGIEHTELGTVSFEAIAAQHVGDVSDFRRTAKPRKQRVEHGYVATSPDVRCPSVRPEPRNTSTHNRN